MLNKFNLREFEMKTSLLGFQKPSTLCIVISFPLSVDKGLNEMLMFPTGGL